MATEDDDPLAYDVYQALIAELDAQGPDHPLLLRTAGAAKDYVERQLGFKIADRFGGTDQQPVPPSLIEAVHLLAAHWLENREATLVGVTAQPLPFGVDDIVANFRDYSFG